jgi:hypothetical protein
MVKPDIFAWQKTGHFCMALTQLPFLLTIPQGIYILFPPSRGNCVRFVESINSKFLYFILLIIALTFLFASCQEPEPPISSKSGGRSLESSIGSVIAFDEGHNNIIEDYSLFGLMEEYLSAAGFVVRQHLGTFTLESLDGIHILHIANAVAPENQNNWSLPTPSAFTPEEIEVLYNWVNDGGSLLMVIDHMPFGGSFEDLAGAFDIEVSNGFAVDERFLSGYSNKLIGEAGYLVSRRTDGTLVNHPILDDTEPYGRIELLATDAGSAFRLPAHAFSLITFGPNILSLEPEVSWEFDSGTARRRVTGWSQAGVIEVGKGHVAVLGDNFLFIAPAFLAPPLWDDEKSAKFGIHNAQFTLNLLHWLSGHLEKRM